MIRYLATARISENWFFWKTIEIESVIRFFFQSKLFSSPTFSNCLHSFFFWSPFSVFSPSARFYEKLLDGQNSREKGQLVYSI